VKISVYCYDDVQNPRCGGGGAFRELAVHRAIATRHTIRYFTGNFPGAKDADEPGISFRHLGTSSSYLLSRVTFSLLATFHSLVSKADIVAIPFSIYSPVLTFLLKPRNTVVLFFHVTGWEAVKKYGIAGLFPWLMEKTVLGFGRNFITLTDSMSQAIAASRPDVKARAGYANFDTSMLSDSKEDGNYILCFGRIDVRMKGIDILIEAFEKIACDFPLHRLVIAGRGKEADITWVKKRAKGSSFQTRIQVLTNVGNDEKRRLFRAATFVCMPSRFEGWNIAAIEASASSKATLGTRISGLSDAIRDGETGLLVPPENAGALAEKMTLLLGDSRLRAGLGANGNAWARNFTLEKVAKIQEDFYTEVFKAARQKTKRAS
jgi:glycosyltransferase involved in cell wall biosynthesis